MRTTTSSRVRARQRRIVALAAGPVLIAGMALAVSFTNNFADGTQVAGVRVNHADYVWPVKDDAPMPFIDVADVPTTLKAGTALTLNEGVAATSTVTNWRYPSWTVEDTQNEAANATVDIEGDIALIDARGADTNGTGTGLDAGALGTARTGPTTTFPKDYALNRDNLKSIKVNMFVENMNEMREAYSSYYLPIRVYKYSGTTWSLAAGVDTTAATYTYVNTVGQSGKYLHSLDGTMSFTFPACNKCFYGITIGEGGNLHVTNQGTTGTTIAGAVGTTRPVVVPKLYFTASAINHSNN